MANPVLEALVLTRATERLAALHYEPPRSWTKEAKLRFLDLPADLQVYLIAREKDRDREVRRCQNDASAARKELAAVQQQLAAIQTKEIASDTEPKTTAAA